MKLIELLDLCEFTDFPFDIKPTTTPQVWAGRRSTLAELTHLKDNVIVNGLSEFGIITGDHASGKSHALLHLRYMVDSMPRDLNVPRFTIYIDNPIGLGPHQSFVENYSYIIGSGFGFESIVKIFKTARETVKDISTQKLESMEPEARRPILRDDAARDEFDERVYNEIVGSSPIPYKAIEKLSEGNREVWDWLTGTNTKILNIEGKNVQRMTSHIICAKALATVIKLGTLRKPDGTPALMPAVFILVDQAEDLPQAGKNFNEQIVGWRTLIDEVEKSFGMLWAMDGKSEDIYANFTDAIHRRQTVATEKLRLESLQKDDAIAFLTEVIQKFRKPRSSVPTEIYPFKKDGLEEIVTQTPGDIQPGNLLIVCRRVFTKAAEENAIKSKKDHIDAAMVKRYA